MAKMQLSGIPMLIANAVITAVLTATIVMVFLQKDSPERLLQDVELNGRNRNVATTIVAAAATEEKSSPPADDKHGPAKILDYFNKDEKGYIKIPAGVTSIIIDVGTELIPIWPDNPGQDNGNMVISFEPNKGQCEQIHNDGMARYNGRFWCINIAAANYEGISVFHENRMSATSSMLKVVGGKEWGGAESFDEVRRYVIPVTYLEPIFAALPPHIPISFFKVDAQGYDCEVLKGVRTQMHRAQKVQAEVSVFSHTMYEGECSRDEMIKIMDGFGFKLDSFISNFQDGIDKWHDLIFIPKTP